MATPRYSLDLNTGIRTDLSSGQTYDTRNQQAISSDTLQSNPSPLKLPEETTTSNPSFNLTPLETEAEKIAKIKTTQESDITSLLKEMGGVQGKEGQYQEDLGATQAKQDYDRYSADIEQEKRNIEKFERDILRNNPTGALRGGQADLLRNAQRESLQKQADSAILGNASLGKYNTALEIAKNKVEMELKPLQAELDAKKFIYEQNKDLFSTAQLSKLNSLIKADEAKIEEEKVNKLKANEMIINALSLSAPTSAINNAKDILANGGTATEVAMALGKYSGDYYKVELLKQQIETEKAQRANIYANIDKTKAESGAGKPATQAQYTASGFASRVVQAKDIIDSNSANLSGLSTVEYLGQRNLPNALQSPLIQQQLQAERNFVNAVLRRESGAAISPEEFKSAEKQYFPMPGDSAEVLAQKKANRDLTSANLINESGTAYSVPPPVNKFSLSLGKTGQTIPGSSIVQSVAPTGSINFIIPNSPKK